MFHQRTLSQSQEKSQSGLLSLQRDDCLLSENADEVPALVNRYPQKKGRYSSPNDSSDEGKPKPGVGTWLFNNGHLEGFSKAYKRLVGEEEIESIVKHEPSNSFYVKLKESAIPKDWSNDPHHLKLSSSFNGSDEQDVSESFKSEFAMPDPIPVIENHGYNQGLVLIDGGDGKYYLWHDVSDDVFEVYERNLT